MLHYARLDTHYLLEIWDKILQDLWKQAEKMNI
jgi:ribonuclease D